MKRKKSVYFPENHVIQLGDSSDEEEVEERRKKEIDARRNEIKLLKQPINSKRHSFVPKPQPMEDPEN